jgi:hypothetical protein
MNGASDRRGAREERRRLRDDRRAARRRCDSLAYAVRGPVTLITLGVLFALSNFKDIGFDRTWPVLLIVFGLFTLIGRGTAPATQANPPQPAGTPAPPPAGDWQQQTQPGGYRQSGYSNPAPAPESRPGADTPSGATKGGFGTSAPQRPDQGQKPPEGGAA